MKVNGVDISISEERDPANIPWAEKGVEIVLESTGVFRTRELCMKHVEGGAKKVLLSVPSKGDVDATIVFGVNHDTLKPEDVVVSNASCTTNCLAPMVKVLNDTFGVVKGLMTTVHSYTNDQRVLDMPHSDLRRSRSAGTNLIPTSTGAAIAVGKVIPELNGKLNGLSIRTPTPVGSITDLVSELKVEVTKEEVNAAFKKAAEGEMNGIMEYTEDPIVLSDVIGNPNTSIIDALSTMVVGDGPKGNLVKTMSWYDNEWGYSSKCVDLIKMMAE
jgi:glyceraldehyde 3-phosphate dehydrogenase